MGGFEVTVTCLGPPRWLHVSGNAVVSSRARVGNSQTQAFGDVAAEWAFEVNQSVVQSFRTSSRHIESIMRGRMEQWPPSPAQLLVPIWC